MATCRSTLGFTKLISILILCMLTTAAVAQRATLTGKVTDVETGDALPGANVLVTSGGVQTGAATNTDGQFRVRNIIPGSYKVTVSYIGYETSVTADVELVGGETKNLDIQLKPTGIEINPISITASRRAEKTLDAPASVSVLEAVEISQDVAPSSSYILRNVTGIDMATTGVDRREIVMRGFNNAFSGEAYVLTDNRQSSVASLGVNLHAIMPNMNTDLERIEIVRGPGAALYGAGVDEGVIHYLTKDPFTYPGTTFSFSGGERSSIAGQFRHAGILTGKLGYKVTGQYAQADDWELNPEDPLDKAQLDDDAKDPNTGQPLNPRNYDYKKLNVNGMLQYRFSDSVSLTANFGYSQLDAVVLSGIGTLQADGFGYTYGQLRFQSGNFFAQTYLNKNNVGDSFVYGTDSTLVDNSTLLNVQAQYNLEMADGKQQFIFGVDYDRITPDTEGTIYGRFEDRDLISESGAYFQSQTAFSSMFNLTAALRFDYNNLQEELVLSPRVGLVLKPTPEHSFRATFNRAFTSPGNTENFLDIIAREPDQALPIQIRGMGSAFGFTFERNPAFLQFANSDLIAYSLNPASLGAPQPVGLPLDATYASVYQGLSQIPIPVLKSLLPAPLNLLPDEQIAGLIALFDPSLTQVNGFSKGVLGMLNPTSGNVDIIPDVTDIQPLDRNTTQTFELGYKGLIQDRVLFAVDVYFTNKKNFVGPLLMESPFVLVPTLAPDLQAALAVGIANNPTLAATLQSVGFTAEQVAELIVGLAADGLPSASTPVAIVTPKENAPALDEQPELLLAYRNFGNVNFWGIDATLQILATPHLNIFGNLSIVSDDFFDNDELDESSTTLHVALNAPKFKTKFGFNYMRPLGLSINASARYIKGFPVASGPYVGGRPAPFNDTTPGVENYFLLDVGAGYDLGHLAPGLRIDFLIQNVLDNDHREFLGAPKIGRLAMARLNYTIR